MSRKTLITAFMVLMIASMGCSQPAGAAKEKAGPDALSTTLDDQTQVAITIYNVNLGLVKDQREIRLGTGTSELRFMDVASQIIPTSVYIRSIAEPGSILVLEQNYEYDLLNPQKLLEKYVGKEVKLYYRNPYTEREEIVVATLLSNNGGPIFKINDEITFGHPGRIIFPKVPENLISKPTLVWLLQNDLRKPQKLEATYLTNGINWRADYVVTLNDRDDRADLSGWVSIDNKSGTTYKKGKIKLALEKGSVTKDEYEAQIASIEKNLEGTPSNGHYRFD